LKLLSTSYRHAAWALVVAVVIVCIHAATPATAQDQPDRELLVIETSKGTYEFDVEIARTREQQSRGLMFRRTLGPRDGMLFVHAQPELVTMWMRNTYISLDMIFIRADGRIHRIENSAEPLSERIITSGDRVTAVLELRAGTAELMGIKPGDLVRHPHFNRSK
jgi:uncharacterized membrane protein (UPF0127 family)